MNESILTLDSVHGRIMFSRFRQYPYGTLHIDTSFSQLSNLPPLTLHFFNQPLNKSLDVHFDKNNIKVHRLIESIITDTLFNMESGYFDDNTIELYMGILSC